MSAILTLCSISAVASLDGGAQDQHARSLLRVDEEHKPRSRRSWVGESSATKGERPPKALYGTGWSFPPRAKATEPIQGYDEPPLQHRRPSSYLFTAVASSWDSESSRYHGYRCGDRPPSSSRAGLRLDDEAGRDASPSEGVVKSETVEL
ncbi:hypothetical protein EMIHUDRAFT_448850 [Emiliania huxleyi CCMP1516]|uniref:Secreted protein n=2 Tax=Emiliania huxleyi TaxID=2903 RepID=A0A0D3KUU1_EMIH1|nr:hypothetical protein EMIHUDRAFT_448850 [Emiliania huxleyi CCMP1516]EOD39526.1 hypothetical protein EMIHUDRAFT_448850 [Emiliania huxleyi CCMP1516]|eukprot:XP_005791955.1 hypothetical protein EMIHUDRAFT_448850 [Emiliania huxleyi CCMP1516]